MDIKSRKSHDAFFVQRPTGVAITAGGHQIRQGPPANQLFNKRNQDTRSPAGRRMINCNSDFGEEEQNYGGLATPTYKREFVVKGNPGHTTHE